jgi:cholesterol transport system auxiliary component
VSLSGAWLRISEGAWLLRRGVLERGLKALPVAILALALGSCSFFRPPPETFELTGPQSIPKLNAGTAAQILIPEPTALKTLDSERIVVASGPKLSYVPKAQWPDRMPRVLQAKAIEAFEKSRRAKAVGRPGEGLSIDYQLLINVRSFEFRESGGDGVGYIEISVKLMDDRTGRIISAKVFKGESAVEDDKAEDIVAGVDAALKKVLVDLVRWTLSAI